VGNSSFWKKQMSLRGAVGEEPVEPVAGDPPAESVPALPAGDYGWLTVDVDPQELVPQAMPTIAAPPVSAQAAPTPEPAPEVELEAIVPPEVAEPAGERVPFWKRDLKLERKPKAAKEPKQKKEKAAKAAKAEQTPGAPFWKRELNLKRTPKAERAEKPAKAEKAQGTPFWKLELTFKRTPKAEGEAKPAKQPKQSKQSKGKAAKAPAPGKGVLIGLKIGASQVAAARVANGGRPQLLQVAREPLADGVVVGGELRDVEALAQSLRELFDKNKLPKKNVRLGIANNRIGVRTFEIAGIDDPRQLANAIRFRAQETLPIPLEESALDWQVLDEWQDEETGQKVRRVLLVVAYRELVDRYILACKKAGLKLSGIDLEAFAMLRALKQEHSVGTEGDPGAQVVVNVGHDRSTFAVSAGGICEFTRVLGWGGQNLSVAIARALDVTPSEATPVKHALSLLDGGAPPEGIDPATLAAAREASQRELQAFARELVSSLRFYQNQPGSLGIGELVLTGGTAHLPGFGEELHRLTGVPVRVGDPLTRVAVPKKLQTPDDASVGSLTVAIGLGIED
jgi:type IV pilus assembly protein PilM